MKEKHNKMTLGGWRRERINEVKINILFPVKYVTIIQTAKKVKLQRTSEADVCASSRWHIPSVRKLFVSPNASQRQNLFPFFVVFLGVNTVKGKLLQFPNVRCILPYVALSTS